MSKRITLVSYDFYPPRGGIGVEAFQLFSRLGSRPGIEPLVVSGQENRLAGHLRMRAPSPRSLGWVFFSLLFNLSMKRLVKRLKPDILQVYGGPGGVMLIRRPPVPVLYVANHTYAQQHRYLGRPYYRLFMALEARGYRIARAIVAISSTTRDSLVHDYGVSPEKVTVIPVGVDTGLFDRGRAKEMPRSVLYVGRLARRKNVGLLLESIGIVADSIPKIELFVAGEGGERKTLERRTEEMGLSGRVTFLGKVSDGELADWYNRAAVFVLPSLFEGFGIVCAEAMASGTPVVAVRSPGVIDIIGDEEFGVLVEPDPVEMSAAIKRLLSDEGLRRSMSEVAYDRARSEFDWETISGRFERVYEEILGGS